MSNLMKVPHTVTFEAVIDLDKVPSSIINQLINLDEQALVYMCKDATISALGKSNFLPFANENNSWAEVTVKENN